VAASDWLIDVAWNGAPPASATTRLHGLISDLRRALPTEAGAVILTRGACYLLDVAGEEIDLFQVRTLMSLARAHRDQGEAAAAAPIMAQALGLWRGTPFDGLECAEVQAEADLIDQARADGLEEFAELELELGRHTALASRLAEWTARYPLREGLVGCLMRALARSGRQAEAIAAYHELRGRLADNLGVDPAPPLPGIYRSILDGDRELLASGRGPALAATQAPLRYRRPVGHAPYWCPQSLLYGCFPGSQAGGATASQWARWPIAGGGRQPTTSSSSAGACFEAGW
jgi:DNA-binding SARP family transcriptional activator